MAHNGPIKPPAGMAPPPPGPPPMILGGVHLNGIAPRKQKLAQARAQLAQAFEANRLQDDGLIEEINALEAQADALFARIENRDPEAKTEYLALSKEHEKPYSEFRRAYILPLIAEKNHLEECIKTHDTRLQDALAPLQSRLTQLNEKRETYLRQKEQFKNIPAITNKIQHCLDNEICIQMQEIIDTIQATGEKLEAELNQLGQNLTGLKNRLTENNTASLVLSAKAACFPALKKAKAQAVAAAPKVVDTALWAERGLLVGFFLDNLKKFVLLEGEVAEEYTDQRLFNIYNHLAKQPFFDEKMILAIAAGFIYRPQGSFCFRQMSVIDFLQNSQQDKGVEAALDFLLTQVYEQFPNLKEKQDKGNETVLAQAIEHIDQVMAVVDHKVPMQHAGVVVGEPDPGMAKPPKLNAVLPKPPVENEVPVRPRLQQRDIDLAALEERNQAAFEAGNQIMVEQGYQPNVAAPEEHKPQPPQPNHFDNLAAHAQEQMLHIQHQQQLEVKSLQAFFDEFVQLEAFIFEDAANENENVLHPERAKKLTHAVLQIKKEKELAEKQAQKEQLARQRAEKKAQQERIAKQKALHRSNQLLVAKNTAIAKLKTRPTQTPQSIIQSEGSAGLNKAIELYKRTHANQAPTQKTVQSWANPSVLSDRSFQLNLRRLPR